jgi:aryl-alcohol dehydrogenase-like predicted oxidoreductase
MEKRRLGKSDLMIAPLMLGGNVFGWTADEKTSFAVLDAFADAGLNAIDTADVYSAFVPGNKGGESETVLGNWFAARKNRDKVVVATKVGMLAIDGKAGLSKDHIARAVEASLKRLRTDYIDLYFAHRDDESTPLEETLEAFAGLVKAGKVRALGASNYSAARLAEALAIAEKKSLPRYEALQPLYNLSDRKVFEAELEAACRDHAVGVVPYFALAAGFLTGKYRSEADAKKSPRGERVVKNYLNPRGLKILAALDEIAARLKATPGQVAIAWLIARPAVTAPIASATSVEQLHDLIAAVNLKLDRDALAALDAASAEG